MTDLEIKAVQTIIALCPEETQEVLTDLLNKYKVVQGEKEGLEEDNLQLEEDIRLVQIRNEQLEEKLRSGPAPDPTPVEMRMALSGDKIEAIKYYRTRTCLSLKESKDVIDAAMNKARFSGTKEEEDNG